MTRKIIIWTAQSAFVWRDLFSEGLYFGNASTVTGLVRQCDRELLDIFRTNDLQQYNNRFWQFTIT